MPQMDGYEFARQLRADPVIGNTPVIFSTAHYLEQEASALARACGISWILYKPCEPEEVLRTVDAALGLTKPPQMTLSTEEIDREHLRLLTDKLREKVEEVSAIN
jgi:CheY-like chemotaxis protein